jgi:hypothetical protein
MKRKSVGTHPHWAGHNQLNQFNLGVGVGLGEYVFQVGTDCVALYVQLPCLLFDAVTANQ